MQACVLPNRENSELRRLLSLEYISADASNYVSGLIQTLQPSAESLYATQETVVINNFFNTINKILLEDVFQYTHLNNYNHLLELLQHRTYQYNITVSPITISDFLHGLGIFKEEDKQEAENTTIQYITVYLESFFKRHYDELTNIIVNLAMMFNSYLSNIRIRYGKFEIVGKDSPMLFYTEEPTYV